MPEMLAWVFVICLLWASLWFLANVSNLVDMDEISSTKKRFLLVFIGGPIFWVIGSIILGVIRLNQFTRTLFED